MPPLGSLRPHSNAGERPPFPPPSLLPWRGGTFLLSGGSLPLDGPHQRRRRYSLGISLALQCGLTLLIIASVRFGSRLPPLPLHEQVTLLTFPLPPAPVYVPPPRHRPHPVPIHSLRLRPHPIPPPLPPPLRLPLPQPPTVAALAPVSATPPRLTPVAPPPPPPSALKFGTFGAPHGLPKVAAKPVPAPALGNFGGARAQPDPPDPPSSALTRTAGFDGPASADPAPTPATPLHSAGFTAAASPGAASPEPGASVHLHNFAAPPPRITSPQPQPSQPASDFQPPRILAWPTPAYTPDAVQHHIQGEVVLQVRLGAGGDVQVLRLVQGLGYGLNQTAMAAARQLRFRPARRRGQPVDWIVLLHISFRLAY